MLNDTIRNVPDDCLSLGSARRAFRYNGFEFRLEVTAHPSTATTNDYARKRSYLNMEANIRKSVLGLGHGQYLEPEEVKNLQNGRVVLSTFIAGKQYNIPVSVSPRGECTTEVMKGKFSSLRDVAAKLMDGILEYNGIDNAYAHSQRYIGQDRAVPTAPAAYARPTHSAPAMRM